MTVAEMTPNGQQVACFERLGDDIVFVARRDKGGASKWEDDLLQVPVSEILAALSTSDADGEKREQEMSTSASPS